MDFHLTLVECYRLLYEVLSVGQQATVIISVDFLKAHIELNLLWRKEQSHKSKPARTS